MNSSQETISVATQLAETDTMTMTLDLPRNRELDERSRPRSCNTFPKQFYTNTHIDYNSNSPMQQCIISCKHHRGKPIEHFCEDCEAMICIKCMTDRSHRGHTFTNLSDVFEEKKDYLNNFVISLEGNTLHKLENQLQFSADNEKRYINEVEKIEREIKIEKDTLKREIDSAFGVVEKDLASMKRTDVSKLRREQENILSQIKTVRNFISESKQHIRSHDQHSLLQFMNQHPALEDLTRDCKCVKMEPPSYQKRQNDYSVLKAFCGIVRESKEHSGYRSPLVSQPFIRRIHRQKSTSMMHCPVVIKSFDIGHYWDLILKPCGSMLDCIWVGYKESKIILIDANGHKKKKIKCGFHFEDFVENAHGEMFISVQKENCIRKYAKGKFKTFVATGNWNPLGICISRTGDLLVSMTHEGVGKIVRYGSEGNVITEATPHRRGSPLLNKPNKLHENVDKSICILNLPDRNIVMLNENMNYKMTYDGSGDGRKKAQFYPTGVCTDKRGHILIADHNNHCIDLLDRNGIFFMYLVTENKISNPRSVCVDGDGMAWVEYLNGKGGFKILMYLS